MKRCVFLCFLMVLGFSRLQVFAENQEETTFTFERNRNEEEVFTLELIATGKHQFTVRIGCDDMRYYANNAFLKDEKVYVYGYVNDKESDHFFQAWLWVLDVHGETLHNQIMPFGDISEIVKALQFEEGLVFLVEQSERTDRAYHFEHTHMVLFDVYYEEYSYETLDFQVMRYTEHDNRWLLSKDYHGHYDVAVSHDLSLFWRHQIVGVEPYQEYIGEVKIEFINSVLINDERFEHGVTLDYPGHYTLQFDETIIPFTIHPRIIGVEDGLVSSVPITLDVPKGQLFLNGDLYVSKTIIEEPGEYVFIVKGINQYEHSIRFTIDSNLDGILHNQVYQTPRTITFAGEGYLNHKPFKSGTTIQEEGIYTLDIYGVNGYHERHRFHITVEEVSSEAHSDVWLYRGGFILVICLTVGYLTYRVKLKK